MVPSVKWNPKMAIQYQGCWLNFQACRHTITLSLISNSKCCPSQCGLHTSKIVVHTSKYSEALGKEQRRHHPDDNFPVMLLFSTTAGRNHDRTAALTHFTSCFFFWPLTHKLTIQAATVFVSSSMGHCNGGDGGPSGGVPG